MIQATEYQGPLAGLKVIDFGHYYAGPVAAMLLADQGASVIRIMRPGKRELREEQFLLLNRNKKLLELDLKAEEGKKQALSLIEKADVVIENFRPGVMKRLGLDYTSVKSSNPSLIYLSLPGFASTDKERAHIQAWEGILSAAVGLYTDAHLHRSLLNFPPVYSWSPLCSIYGGVNGAIAVMAALLAREKHHVGTVIEAPLLDAGFFAFCVNIINDSKTGLPRGLAHSKQEGIKVPGNYWAYADESGDIPDQLRDLEYSPNDTPNIQLEKLEEAKQRTWLSPCCRMYPCGDGRIIYLWPFEVVSFINTFFEVLGIKDQVRREGFLNEGPWLSGTDNSIGDRAGMSAERKERLTYLIGNALLSKSSFEWETLLGEAGVPAAVVRSRDEWLALKPMIESGVLRKMACGMTVPGRMVDIAGPDGALMSGFREPTVITWDEADELLSGHDDIKFKGANQSALKKGDLLKGLKVLDLGNVAAAPIGAATLALYGADVIQAVPPEYIHPEPLAAAPVFFQGKRSILTDIKSTPGKQVFNRLVSWADVVTHNILDDTAWRMGASHEQLKEINPKVVSCQVSAFGGTYRGFWEGRRAFDLQLSAAAGMLAHYGSLEQPHTHAGVAQGDIMGGYGLAFSALLAVWQQRRTGYAGEGRTSLARVICYSQLPFMIARNGSSDCSEAHGQIAVGDNRFQRIYTCNDGWIYVGASEEKAGILAKIIIGNEESNSQALETAFSEKDCMYWLNKLDTAGIAAHRVMSVDDIYSNARKRSVSNDAADDFARGSIEIARWDDHPSGIPLVLAAPTGVRIGECQSYFRPMVYRKLGEHTREILCELGYRENEIEELIRLKVSHEYLPAFGSKDAYFYSPKK